MAPLVAKTLSKNLPPNTSLKIQTPHDKKKKIPQIPEAGDGR